MEFRSMKTLTSPPDLLDPLKASSGYSCDLIDDVARLAELESGWEKLEASSTSPMESFGWAMASAVSLAREQAPHVVVTTRDDTPCAIAPLARCRGWGLGRLEVLGMSRLNEPGDLIFADHEALSELIEQVVRLRRPLLLGRLPSDSPTIQRLKQACRRRALVIVRPQASCPYIPLDESWLEPESHLSSRRRSDYRRALRRAEKRGTVRAEVLTPQPEEVEELLDIAFEIEARSWKGAAGTALANDPNRGRFIREFSEWASHRGRLRICLLRIGDELAAMQVAVEQAARLSLLKIGFDPVLADCSPGILLLAESLRYAARQRLASFEFLGTVEPWTRVWTEHERACVAVRVYPFGLRGAAALLADSASALGRRLKQRALRLRKTDTADPDE
jgi:CelD/BcsL family acetyltransferase involved in cellulose biosynthesis